MFPVAAAYLVLLFCGSLLRDLLYVLVLWTSEIINQLT